jgi:hypothetical protein
MPLVVILIITYHGLLKEMKKDFGHFNRPEIIDFGDPDQPDKVLIIANAKNDPEPSASNEASGTTA